MAVHILGLFFGIFGTGIVYLLSDARFTKANATNAVNWQIFVLVSSIVFGLMAFGLESVSGLFVIVGAFGILIVGLLDLVFCVLAAFKALGGAEWKYPITPTFL
ncbi:DUF4870 domain-containing protein [Halorussus pelagicus]|uniref:DUF4870 domain-containing protein n=1 Tax=Halorussus pelagicus TaxID=2505977 RepID=UPI00140BF458|nr:DUF4870 domain-containing protein [Halorussus pelagicus]